MVVECRLEPPGDLSSLALGPRVVAGMPDVCRELVAALAQE